jgi:23S rRNA pseudouridine1911/1915/1917 synthase
MKSRIDNLLEIMPRQALHAKTLGFFHPHSGKFMRFDSPLPEDFIKLIEKLKS